MTMTNDAASFFGEHGGDGSGGAPSFKFGQIGDTVKGEIISQREMEQKDMTTNQPIPDNKRPGQNKKMLQIILKTNLRNWEGCAKAPVDNDGNPIPASDDEGARAVYVKGWMIGALGDAIRASSATVPYTEVGGRLAVRYASDRPSGKGNPIKIYQAQYAPPAPGAGIFAEEAQEHQAQAAGQAAAAQAPLSVDDDIDVPF